MVAYVKVEPDNQQDQPGIDFCLTPRVERYVDGVWHTNLYDLKAKVETIDEDGVLKFKAAVHLANSDREHLNEESSFILDYQIDKEKTIIKAKRTSKKINGDTLVLPIISPTGEKVVQTSKNKIEIHKPEGVVYIESNVSITIKETEKERVFNQVPGMEVLPMLIVFPNEIDEVICSIKIV
jgi:hypothetical protein